MLFIIICVVVLSSLFYVPRRRYHSFYDSPFFSRPFFIRRRPIHIHRPMGGPGPGFSQRPMGHHSGRGPGFGGHGPGHGPGGHGHH